MNNLKHKISVLALAVLVLVGCTEPAKVSTHAMPAATPLVEDPTAVYIQPTSIPTQPAEVQALLDQLASNDQLNSDSHWRELRLSLFLRYTQLTNDPDRQLSVLEPLIELINSQHPLHPEDPELTALLGSATLLTTTFFLDDLGKVSLLSKQGSRYLDRAVKTAPHHLGVRLYRGITYAEMPAFLGKARQAVTDLSLLKSHVDKSIGTEFTLMVDYYLALALINDGKPVEGLPLLTQVARSNVAPWSARATTLIKAQG